MGAKIPSVEAHSEFIGIVRFSERGAQIAKDVLEELVSKGWDRPFQDASSLLRAGLTDFLQELIDGPDIRPTPGDHAFLKPPKDGD